MSVHRLRLTSALAFAVSWGVICAGGVFYAQAADRPTNDLPNLYRTIENWAKLPPGRPLGATSAVDIDRDGRSIWVAERCGSAVGAASAGAGNCAGSGLSPILKFDAAGNVVKSFGQGLFVLPHGIYVDRDGNVWVADASSAANQPPGRGHQVFKFSPDGKILLTLGRAGVPGDGPDTFNRPSDVVVSPNGDIFVADGHGGDSNARVVKFSKDGTFIKAWGKKGTATGEFDIPHALAIDSQRRLFVADAGNNRIQIFDLEGTFLAEWKQFSRPQGLFIDARDVLYVADSGSTAQTHAGWVRGIRIGSARDGTVTGFIPDPTPTADPVTAAEGVTVDAAGNLYGSVVGAPKLLKYVKR